LHDPALTAARFVTLEEYGGPFYRTGDLARVDSAGLMHYVGRNDTQVQIYGNRVELSEIEAVLLLAGAIRTAVAVDVTIGSAQRIVAFVVPAPSPSPLIGASVDSASFQGLDSRLKDFLAARLPRWMIPHRILELSELPLTQAGKVDRRKLREMARRDLADDIATTPDTLVEQAVASVWRQVLRINAVKPTDDFFLIGGDSILVLEMLHRLEERFRHVPRPHQVYAARTLRTLAALVEKLNAGWSSPGGPVIAQPDARALVQPSALSSAQRGFLLGERLSRGRSPVWSAEVPVIGLVEAARLQVALDFLVVRHPMLRTAIRQVNGTVSQEVMEPRAFPLTIVNLQGLSLTEAERLRIEAFDALRAIPFDVAACPLARIQLVRAPGAEYLQLCIHHIVGDGWSLHVLADEVLRLYDQLTDGQQPQLPPLKCTYLDAIAARDAAIAEVPAERKQAAVNFWQSLFAASGRHSGPLVLNNADSARPRPLSPEVPVQVTLKRAQAGALEALAREEGVTPFIVYLTLWLRTLARLTGDPAPLTGIALSGRDLALPGIETIVGCLATALPFRITLPPDSFLEQCRAVQRAFAIALEHDVLPPEVLADVGRAAGEAAPGFRYFFSYMNFSSLGEYTGRAVTFDWNDARFHFDTQGVRTAIMGTVAVMERTRCSFHGMAGSETLGEAAALFAADAADVTGEVYGATVNVADGNRASGVPFLSSRHTDAQERNRAVLDAA
ncbi:MAG: condensation domain-containing protein, partial [Gemmatimonadota bacterium]|nr:condensation domain-containing protein [Gemmatimonadota bacterium]